MGTKKGEIKIGNCVANDKNKTIEKNDPTLDLEKQRQVLQLPDHL